MEFVNLGRSGLKVSPICLGTGIFGYGPTAATPEDEGRRIIHAYLDAGHNFIDTADGYEGGESEEVLGRALKGRRDGVVVATKAFIPTGPGPNDRGLSRTHLREALDASLRRLGTDYVDLYQCHSFDPSTPLEETMATLASFVEAGKVRYIGCCNFSGSQIVDAQWAASRASGPSFVSLQSRYSLVYRGIETDALLTARRHGLGVMAYSPLAGGVLTGKYRRGSEPPPDSRAQRMAGQDPSLQAFRRSMTNDRNMDIADTLQVVAEQIGARPAAVALAWVRARLGVTSPIIGPRTFEQYEQYVEGFDLVLPPESVQQLEDVSQIPAWVAHRPLGGEESAINWSAWWEGP
jgi:aryl-alcohol dehydrogenase-like predicted oxidoreductase